jgi:hypothetical protein
MALKLKTNFLTLRKIISQAEFQENSVFFNISILILVMWLVFILLEKTAKFNLRKLNP